MLHMVLNTHNAESCAFRSEEDEEALLGAFRRMEDAARAHDTEVKGVWANMASHTVFALVDAPNAHAVDALVRESGLIGRTDTRVYAVVDMETAMEAASR